METHLRMGMKKKIETENLLLIAANRNLLKSAIEGNRQLEKHLKAKVPDSWTAFGKEPLLYFLDKIKLDISEQYWCTYFPVHKKDNTLIGSCCYKGKPTNEGTVEIGYEIAPDYRLKGFASEMVYALIENVLPARMCTSYLLILCLKQMHRHKFSPSLNSKKSKRLITQRMG